MINSEQGGELNGERTIVEDCLEEQFALESSKKNKRVSQGRIATSVERRTQGFVLQQRRRGEEKPRRLREGGNAYS